VARIAPTTDFFLMRAVMRDPPLYTMNDLRTWVTLSDVFAAEEIMNLEAAQAEKAERAAKLKARQ
jgi:hypothetical protein